MQGLNLKIKGLYTYPNPLSEVPEGALSMADNIVINSDSVAEPRRGFDHLTYAFSDPSYRAHALTGYQSKIITNYATNKMAWYDTASGWTDYSGSIEAPDTLLAKMKFAQANSNLLFTSSAGVRKLDAYTAAIAYAGMAKALDVTPSLTGASGFMADNTQVAYRVVWGFKDLNKNVLVGAPSARAVVSNSAGATRDVSLVITIPAGITTAHFFQIYRSGMSASSSTEPSDEVSLVYEANPTTAEITALSITLTDATPDSLRGAPLYTNASQQTISQSNDPPPWCKDIAVFKNATFYANVKYKQRLFITLLGVGGANGFAVDDTITIGGVTFTAKAAEDVAAREFALVTGGTPAQNIVDTAQSLVRVINRQAAGAFYCRYLSGVGELPGKMVLEERTFGGASFAVTVSARGAAWSPTLPTAGTTVSSASDTYKNGIAVSKTDQSEAVPEANLLFAGSAGDDIARILPLRDSLFVLKYGDGIYRVFGDSGSFSVELFDATARILAPESAVVLNNQIWCLSDQGVVAISETGVEVKSFPIEDIFLELFGVARDQVKYYSFGLGYETDRKYILFVPSTAADTYATQAFVYHIPTRLWTRWSRRQTCGLVNTADDKLYLGDALSHKTNIERKTYTFLDYVDEGTTYTISSFSGTTIYLNTVVDIEEGDLLYQSATVKSIITAVDPITTSVTVQDTMTTWTAASATVFKAIECMVQWVPYTAGNPGIQKQFSLIGLFFSTNRFTTAYMRFFSELSLGWDEVPVTGSGGGLFGLFPFGRQAWGGAKPPKPFPVLVPLEKARCSQLNMQFYHRVGQGMFRLNGLSVKFEPMSEVLGQ